MIAIVEVGENYTDRLMTIKANHCSLEEAQKDARDAGYQVIAELCDIVPTTHEVHIIVAVEPEGGKSIEERIKEVFNLEWIRDFVAENIRDGEWIEEEYGEKRKVLVIETLVNGAHGAYIPGMVLELFGQAEGYDLENPYNHEKNESIHEDLMYWENKINDCLNELLPSEGRYYVGYHESDGSYCLFYEEYEEEEMEQV